MTIHGWTSRYVNGVTVDICPDCQDKAEALLKRKKVAK